MTDILGKILIAFLAFSAGTVIAGAVFAFITVIGVVPRLAQKTKTIRYVFLYEEAIIFGGLAGAATQFWIIRFPVETVGVVLTTGVAFVFSFCIGVFVGCLAVSLAEILNVIPIMTRRVHIQQGMFLIVLAIAFGKLAGSLLYYTVPGFYHI
jgi:stage V sporulation protein AB